MAYTEPTTLSVGQILTASYLNTYLRNNMRYFKGTDGPVAIENGATFAGATKNRPGGGNSFIPALRLTNPDATDTGGSATGIIFEVEPNGFGKGGIAFERRSGYGVGRLHLLNNNAGSTADPTLADAVLTVDENKRVGIGTTSPQGKVHAVGPNGGGCMFWDYNGFGGTDVQILPPGSVLGALTGIGALKPSSAPAGVFALSGTNTMSPGVSATVYGYPNISSPTDSVVVSCSASGGLYIRRGAGAQTYKVSLWITWI